MLGIDLIHVQPLTLRHGLDESKPVANIISAEGNFLDGHGAHSSAFYL